MEGEALKKYVKAIYELEKQSYTYSKTQDTYVTQIKACENTLTKPDGKIEILPEWQTRQEYKEIQARYRGKKVLNRGAVFSLLILLAAIALIVGLFIAFPGLLCIGLAPAGFVLFETYMWVSDNFIGGLFEPHPKLSEEMDAYFLRCHQEQLKQDTELSNSYIAILNQQLAETVTVAERKSKRLLDFLYSFNIVPAQYRSFIAIAMIHQYLDTGRCSTLEDSDGAIALYIRELKKFTINDDANQIFNQLNNWSNTMPYTTNAIMECHQLQNTIQAAFDARSTQPCGELLKYIETCAQINNGIAREYDY